MTMDDILEAVISACENDQTIADTDVITWTNMCINRINVACTANIPLVSDVGSVVPAFDARFHEALVLFCIAKYREGDTSYSDSTYFMNQFNEMLAIMQRDMVILPSSRIDSEYQQITVTDATVVTYPLSMPYGSYFDAIEVYQNDNLLDDYMYTISVGNRTITFTKVTLTINDKLTIHFQNNSDLNNPPYQWWNAW